MQIMPFHYPQRGAVFGAGNWRIPAQSIGRGDGLLVENRRRYAGDPYRVLAAYNAGPNRVKQWLPDESVPADIWIETIPYTETREYVTSVLVYALIYQQRIQSNELSMNDLTRAVQPLTPNELTMNDLARDVQPLVLTP